MTEKPMKSSFCPSPPPSKRKTIIISSLATLFILCTLSLVLYLRLCSTSRHHHPSSPAAISIRPDIKQACKSTRYQEACESSLSKSNRLPQNPTLLDIINSSIWVSSDNLKTVQSFVEDILGAPVENQNLTNLAKTCNETLRNSQSRISYSIDALPRGKVKEARVWMSAALGYQVGCLSGLKNLNLIQLPRLNDTVTSLDVTVNYTSNALSMVVSYDVFGNDTSLWGPPKTERDGFWGKGSDGGTGSSVFKGGFPSGLKADVTVCGDGCDFKKVQDAVDVAPNNLSDGKFVVHIKEGVYNETVRVPFEKKNVVFLGDGMGKTVITGSLNVGLLGVNTYNTATVGVQGDGFMASGLTIENTAGPGAQQAVAFRSDSDLSIIENVEFLGNQDTLYMPSLRQFYKSCVIQGNVDFIFGNSASFFQNCTILLRPRQLKPEKGETNTITAHGRTDPAQSTGFVFQNCLINGTDEYMKLYNSNPSAHKNFLGRPWKEYSRTVFIHCNLEALINPLGWTRWNGDFALSTLFYGEFENSGAGSDLSKRENWTSKIPKEHIYTYSVENFIKGNEWIPTSS